MKYRNIKTGAVVDIRSELKGRHWEAVAPAPAPETEKKKTATRKKGSKK